VLWGKHGAYFFRLVAKELSHEMRDKLSWALVEFLKKGVFVRKTEKGDLGEIEHVT